MKNIIRTAFLVSIVALAACSTILGPPDSGDEFSPFPPGTSLPYDQFVEGQPDPRLMTVSGGMYIWKTGDQWHVRIARVDKLEPQRTFPPVYSGTILIDNGFIAGISEQNVHPTHEVRVRMNEIFFRFELRSDIEGFDFRIQPKGGLGYCVTADFRFNGMPYPDLVRLGRSMYPPQSLPVTMCFR